MCKCVIHMYVCMYIYIYIYMHGLALCPVYISYGVRTHAELAPVDLKSTPVTTRALTRAALCMRTPYTLHPFYGNKMHENLWQHQAS